MITFGMTSGPPIEALKRLWVYCGFAAGSPLSDHGAQWADFDGDGTGNNADLDDDNDGTPDTTDAFPLNAAESVDTDGDFSSNPAVTGLLDDGYTVVWTNETGTGQSINGAVLEVSGGMTM